MTLDHFTFVAIVSVGMKVGVREGEVHEIQ